MKRLMQAGIVIALSCALVHLTAGEAVQQPVDPATAALAAELLDQVAERGDESARPSEPDFDLGQLEILAEAELSVLEAETNLGLAKLTEAGQAYLAASTALRSLPEQLRPRSSRCRALSARLSVIARTLLEHGALTDIPEPTPVPALLRPARPEEPAGSAVTEGPVDE